MTKEQSQRQDDGNKDEDRENLPKKFTARELRNGSYIVLLFAAIFVVNSMETGSYRTPWPFSIAITAIGVALFIFSLRRKREENSETDSQ